MPFGLCGAPSNFPTHDGQSTAWTRGFCGRLLRQSCHSQYDMGGTLPRHQAGATMIAGVWTHSKTFQVSVWHGSLCVSRTCGGQWPGMASSEQVESGGDIPDSSDEKQSVSISGANRILSKVYYRLCDSGNPPHRSNTQVMLKAGALDRRL